jgi:hypothetical protein
MPKAYGRLNDIDPMVGFDGIAAARYDGVDCLSRTDGTAVGGVISGRYRLPPAFAGNGILAQHNIL